ncbi:hypothetical protein PYCC9005_005833 [Savitreella phatthalungensis]
MPKDTSAKRGKAAPVAAAPARGGKKEKDPNAPKRPLSSYMLFTQDHREVVKAENPDIAFGAIGKALGDKWKSMSDAEKKPYEDKAKKAKADYETAKAKYEKSKK